MNIFESNLNPFNILIKARNQAVDSVFYDVSSLTFEEWLSLTPWVDKKGTIVVVDHSGSRGRNTIRHYPNVDLFLRSHDWRDVHAVVVSGVGSSVIGTAALARNVADYFDGPVAGIVSGYGLSDVVLEGLGGWFFYGKLDQFRYELENTVETLNALISEQFARGSNVKKYLRMYFDSPLDAYVPSNPDVSALHDILLERYLHSSGAKNLRLLVGHSKGNLLIGFILNHMYHALRDAEQDKAADLAFHDLDVVTLGAVVDLPDDMILEENQHQFLGTLDALGRMNSRSIAGDLPHNNGRPGEWHSLNTRLPGHMDVKKILEFAKIPKGPITTFEGGEREVLVKRSNRVAAMAAMVDGN